MPSTLRPARRRKRRPRLHVERLEPRVAFSADTGLIDPAAGDANPSDASAETSTLTQTGPFTVALTDPAPASSQSTSPTTLTLQFSHAINPDTVADDDALLVQVADDGSVLGYTGLAAGSLDPTGTQMTVAVGPSLAPGHYQVFINGSTGLTDVDGTSLIGDGNPLLVGDFSITVAGVTLADALGLATPGPQVTSVSGNLDFVANPYDVALYRIALPAGHFWRLGLEVRAQRDGGTLDSALALLDGAGRPIATDDIGRADAPFDPYLFAGLEPGLYYIGVSGTGNIPGQPGGYDPASGSAGTVPQVQPGGPFTLQLVADPADAPTTLQTFSLDRADPLDPTPTGLSLGFSGAIRVDDQEGSLSSVLSSGIEVVDQSGRDWPLAASSYNEADAHVDYLFRDRLPAGQYTVRLPDQNGLVDLAGRAPVAPGQPSGVLGTFSVAPRIGQDDPHDLGALLPGAALAGVTLNAALDPGDSVTDRLVITFPGLYTLQSQYSGGSLAIRAIGPDGTFSVDPGAPDTINGTNDTELNPGVYQFVLTNTGAEPVVAQLTIQSPATLLESLLLNGVGQGPALNLRLIAPQDVLVGPTGTPAVTAGTSDTTPATPAPVPTESGPPAGAVLAAPSIPMTPSAILPASTDSIETAGVSAPPPSHAAGKATEGNVASAALVSGPLGLFLALAGGPIGRPGIEATAVTQLSLPVAPATTVLASNGVAVPQGINYGAGAAAAPSPWSSAGRNPRGEDLGSTGAMLDGDLVAQGDTAGAVPGNQRAGAPHWSERLGTALAGWLGGDAQAPPLPVPDALTASLPTPGDPGMPQLEPRPVQAAALSSPLDAALLAMLASKYRHRIARWLSLHRRRGSARPALISRHRFKIFSGSNSCRSSNGCRGSSRRTQVAATAATEPRCGAS
jgi:hypothetical protein